MRPTVPSSPPVTSTRRHSRPPPTPLVGGRPASSQASAPPPSPSWPFSGASNYTRSSKDGLRADSYRDPMPRPETALSGAAASSYRTAPDEPSTGGRPVSSGTFGPPSPRGATAATGSARSQPPPQPQRQEASSSGRYDDADVEDASLEASLLAFEARVIPPTDPSASEPQASSGTTSGWVRAQARELAQAEAETALEEDLRAGDFPDSEYTLSHPSPPRAPEPPAERLPPHYPPYPPGQRPPLRESPPSYPRAHPFNHGGQLLSPGAGSSRGAWLDYPQPQYFSSYAGNSGGSWQQLGIGFHSPALTDLPASGGRAARIQARREKLEKRQAKDRARGVEDAEAVVGAEPTRETFEEHLRRVEGREVDWSGADDKGRLVVSRWPKVWRWFAAGLALFELIGLLAARFMASPETSPPQEKKIATYVLWALPFLSWLLAGYMHILRPYLYRKRSIPTALTASHNPVSNGLASVPLLASQQQPNLTYISSGGGCCGRRANEPPPGMPKQEWAMRQRMQTAQPTINLVIQPGQLAGLMGSTPGQATSAKAARRAERREAQAKRKRRAARERRRAVADAQGRDEDEAWDSDTTDSSSEDGSEDGKPTERERQVALHKWSSARSWATKVAAVEVAWGLIWIIVVGAAIAMSGTCPEGAYNDWCLYHNFALAMAVLTALAWWFCAGLGIKTLRRTATPPFSQEATAKLLASVA